MGKQTWTNQEVLFLVENYSNLGEKKCGETLNKSSKTTGKKARLLGLKKDNWNYWSEQEIELLKVHWPVSNKKTLLEIFPERNYRSISVKALELKLKTKIKRQSKGSLTFLDNLDNSSAYWWGFIMGDGCLHDTCLSIQLSNIDKTHIEKIAKHLELKVKERVVNSRIYVYIAIESKEFMLKWKKLLELTGPKTYNPPNVNIFLSDQFFLPFLIGFIDADGHIRKTKTNDNFWCEITIELHKNWFRILQEIGNILNQKYNGNSRIVLTKRGYCRLHIQGNDIAKFLCKNAKSLDYLERKWSKLDFLL
jgi:hypothetical protein